MDTADASVREVVRYLRKNGYRHIKHLGKGGFGNVLSAKMLNESVAIKIVKNEFCWDLEERIWPRLHHKNILPLLDIIEVEGLNLKLFVMPRQPYVLNKVLESDSFLADKNGLKRIKRWMIDILNGLNYLHSSGFAHLDLKTDNVLISDDDRAVLCDFSGIDIVNVPIARLVSPKQFRPPDFHNIFTYKNVEGSRCDVWLFGMMALNILTSKWPSLKMGRVKDAMNWKTVVEPILIDALEKRTFCHLMKMSFPSVAIPGEELLLAHDFVSSIMKWDQLNRPSVSEILSHPFLTDLEIGDTLYETNAESDEVDSVLTSHLAEGSIETKATYGSSSKEIPKTTSNENLCMFYKDRQFENKKPTPENGDILPEFKLLNERIAILNGHLHQRSNDKDFVHKKDDIRPETGKSNNVLDSNIQELEACEIYMTENEMPKNKKKRLKRVKQWIVRKWNGIFKRKKYRVQLSNESE